MCFSLEVTLTVVTDVISGLLLRKGNKGDRENNTTLFRSDL